MAVENNLYWYLDVIKKEDGQLNCIGNATKNMNKVKKWLQECWRMKKAQNKVRKGK